MALIGKTAATGGSRRGSRAGCSRRDYQSAERSAIPKYDVQHTLLLWMLAFQVTRLLLNSAVRKRINRIDDRGMITLVRIELLKLVRSKASIFLLRPCLRLFC